MVFVRTDRVRPTHPNRRALIAKQSDRPQDWPGLVFLGIPTLGPTGLTLHDLSGRKNDGTLVDMGEDHWLIDTLDGTGYVLNFGGDDDHTDQGDIGSETEYTLICRIKKKNRAASTPTSSMMSLKLMYSPRRVDMEIG